MSAAEPALFDVVIAYLVVLVALSSLVSAVLQVLDRVFRLRHRWLRRCLGRLFAGLGLVGRKPAGMEHWTDFRRRWGLGATRRGVGDPPAPDLSSCTAGQLIEAFFGDPTINPSGERGLEAVDGAATAAWIARVRPGGQLDAAPPWWGAFEAGATDGFARGMVVLGFLVGLLFTWGLGIDAIGLGQSLSRSPARVSALIADPNAPAPMDYNEPPDPFLTSFGHQLRRGLTRCQPEPRTPDCEDAVAALLALAEAAPDEPSVTLAALLDARAAIFVSPPGAPALARATREVLRSVALQDGDEAGDPAMPTLEAQVLAALGGADPDPDARLQVRAGIEALGLDWRHAPGPDEALSTLQGLPLQRLALLDHATLSQGARLARLGAAEVREAQAPALGFAGVQRSESFGLRLLGSLLFALFLAGGAPIWFDLLNRLLAIRRGEAPSAG